MGAPNSFHLRAHSCLGAELVQIKMGSLSGTSVPPEVGPGLYLSYPQTCHLLCLLWALDISWLPGLHHFLIFGLLLLSTCPHTGPWMVWATASGNLSAPPFILWTEPACFWSQECKTYQVLHSYFRMGSVHRWADWSEWHWRSWYISLSRLGIKITACLVLECSSVCMRQSQCLDFYV